MIPLGEWIRDRLIEAGDIGITCADLNKERKENPELIYRGGTYQSFARFFHWFKQLDFVEPTGVEEDAWSKGDDVPLINRAYYRITGEGMAASVYSWGDPISALHPEWEPMARKAKYYTPTGRPRGRPRKVLF